MNAASCLEEDHGDEGVHDRRPFLRLAGYVHPHLALAPGPLARVVLDDCLSQVDASTEEEILAGLVGVRRSRTCPIVAHRLSTVRHSDETVVPSGGRIAERGTHDARAASGGRYARSWRERSRAGGLP